MHLAYSGQISALWIVCFGNYIYKRSENGLSQGGYLPSSVYIILLAVLFRLALYHLRSTDAVTSHELCFIKPIIAADHIYDMIYPHYDSHVRYYNQPNIVPL